MSDVVMNKLNLTSEYLCQLIVRATMAIHDHGRLAGVTIVTSEQWESPRGFPMRMRLYVKPGNGVVYSVSATKLLAWIDTEMCI